MSQTVVGVNSPQAVQKWAASLAADVATQAYTTRFTGTGANNVIERKTELEKDSGDTIKYDLNMRFRKKPTYGDNRLDGNEEALKYFQDEVHIDQVRKAGDIGGKMSRKRTLHDFRSQVKMNVGSYMAEWTDELIFAYLSGMGPYAASNEDTLMDDPELVGGFAGNPFEAPDADHQFYSGAATSKASLVAADKMSVNTVERLAAEAKMMNATNRDVVNLRPIKVDASDHFVLCMTPWDAYHMRTFAGDREWNAIQRAAAASEGRKNLLFTGNMGMIAGVVLHEHARVRRMNDYGVGGDLLASRSLFLGQQAGVLAHGDSGTGRYTWAEEVKDYGNSVGIAAGSICGVKKTRFNGKDYGMFTVDSSCPAPLSV